MASGGLRNSQVYCSSTIQYLWISHSQALSEVSLCPPHTLLACLPLARIPTPSCTWQHLTQPSPPFHLKPGQPKVELARSPTSAPASHLQPHPQPPINSRCPSNQMSSLSQPVNLSSTSPLRPFESRPQTPFPSTHDVLLSQCRASQSGAPTTSFHPPPWCLTPCIREPPGAPSRWRT